VGPEPAARLYRFEEFRRDFRKKKGIDETQDCFDRLVIVKKQLSEFALSYNDKKAM
jgi:hypothetical protein